MIKLKKIIKENPDKVYKETSNKDYITLQWDDTDAYAFGIINDKMVISNAEDTHLDIRWYDRYKNIEGIKKATNRNDFKHSGRIWINDRVISFWDPPKTNSELKKILHQIEDEFKKVFPELNVRHLWDNYKIEVYDDKESTSSLVDAKYYITGGVTDTTIQHVVSPVAKIKKNIPGGGWEKRPAGLTPSQIDAMLDRAGTIKKGNIIKEKRIKLTEWIPYDDSVFVQERYGMKYVLLLLGKFRKSLDTSPNINYIKKLTGNNLTQVVLDAYPQLDAGVIDKIKHLDNLIQIGKISNCKSLLDEIIYELKMKRV